ncbi:MAG: diguanylate cyclase [Actinomycetota bacterium]
MPLGLKLFWGTVGVALAAFVVRTLFWPGSLSGLFDTGISSFLLAAGAVSCLLRAALVRESRAPWLVAGLGMASWTIGDTYWSLILADDPDAPFPSLADALYLLQYPAFYAALLLLVRSRNRPLSGGLWLDGAIGALAAGALVAALAIDPIIAGTSGTGLAVATGLAYPIFDLVLLCLVIGVFGVSGWRPGRAWALLGAGFSVSAVADVIYFFQSTTGSYIEGTALDILWPLGSLLIGLAAWQPSDADREIMLERSRVVAVPFLSAVIALGLLVFDHFDRLGGVAVALTAATLGLVTLRMAMAFRDRERMLSQSRTEALVDALTGLRNRRCLMADLERDLASATPSRPLALLLFDLDGFKQYNDSFGHTAGDALLSRLGLRLAVAVHDCGLAYRLGGDEFCALVAPGARIEAIASDCVAALGEHGEGFSVTTSYGVALIPEEADSPVDALKLADRRMYAQKGGGRSAAGRQSRDVLLRTLSERQPELHAHLRGVAELALEVGRELEMTPEELDELARAAELHDVGKVAIPDEILHKRGALDDAEWAFIRRHTIIGERILLAAPALRPVAHLVRSSHERWDGGGYPDGLAAEEIPLGSRVVSVCDAFHAMTTHRSYRSAIDAEEALEELRACAGSQFDPDVVEAFCSVRDRNRKPSLTYSTVAQRVSARPR